MATILGWLFALWVLALLVRVPFLVEGLLLAYGLHGLTDTPSEPFGFVWIALGSIGALVRVVALLDTPERGSERQEQPDCRPPVPAPNPADAAAAHVVRLVREADLAARERDGAPLDYDWESLLASSGLQRMSHAEVQATLQSQEGLSPEMIETYLRYHRDVEQQVALTDVRPLPKAMILTGTALIPLEPGRQWVYREPRHELPHRRVRVRVVGGDHEPRLDMIAGGSGHLIAEELTRGGHVLQTRSHEVVSIEAGAVVARPVPLKATSHGREQSEGRRVMLPRKLTQKSVWKTDDRVHRVAGLADVQVDDLDFRDCVVVEAMEAPAISTARWPPGASARWRTYYAPNVGPVASAELLKGEWDVRSILETMSAPPGAEVRP